MFHFQESRLDKGHRLGKGAFGKVYPYKKSPDDSKWVVKSQGFRTIEELSRCIPEIVLGFACDHPCIVPVKGYFIQLESNKANRDNNKYYVHLKLPRMRGSLDEELKRRKERNLYYSEAELVKHFYSLSTGVDYLHEKKIFHRDIKISNVLLDDKGNLKLSDVGSAKYVPDEDLSSKLTDGKNTVQYTAPELVQCEPDYLPKKTHLFLADSWSLGLTMLELCLLQPCKLNPSLHFDKIQENLQNKRKEVSRIYKEELIDIVFELLQTDSTKRLKAGAVKAKLEERFPHILTGEFKVSLGLKKEGGEQIFNEKVKEILEAFEEEKKVMEAKLDVFQASIAKLEKVCNEKIHQIKAEKNKTVEEMIKKYEEKIQALEQENLRLQGGIQNQVNQPMIESSELNKKISSFPTKILEISSHQRQKKRHLDLKTVVGELKKKWGRWFDFETKDQNDLSIKAWGIIEIDDKVLKGVIKDMIQEWEKEYLWKELDQLEIIINGKNNITDEGLKELASQLGPRLFNVQHLELGMKNWNKITNEGLEVFASELLSRLSNIQKLILNMNNWSKITNEGLVIFTANFGSQFTNLECLELYMGNWSQIKDDGFTKFAYRLGSNLTNLQSLSLGIENWKYITNQSLSILSDKIIQNLTNMRELSLWLNNCSSVTPSEKENLKNQFEKIENVQIS